MIMGKTSFPFIPSYENNVKVELCLKMDLIVQVWHEHQWNILKRSIYSLIVHQ